MARSLVIVESPAKAKTISRILGRDFVVESSIGHIRDLPATAAEVPAAYKSESWARLGVDIENDFKPLYVIASEKKSQVSKLKKLLKEADELYLATDEDREGESIAWHLHEVLSPQIPVKRMVFHEITPQAVRHALESPRDLDRRLVDAQEGRRILDRLFGYEVSPVLWKKILPGLSAGRVQSVATRLIVERERARMRFREASYWDLHGMFRARDNDDFTASLIELDGKRLATGKDFDQDGALTRADAVILDGEAAAGLADGLRGSRFNVKSVEESPYRRSPAAPFMTSSLQQEAARKLNFTARRTMQVAQRLYENGYITYMRTDSVNLSDQAVRAARGLASSMYGSDYVPDQARRYASKVKSAQEAHEAIRPAGEEFRAPDDVAREVQPDEARLYELIWKRTVASQMADAVGRTLQVRLAARSSDGRDAMFAAAGRVITFPGFFRVYVEGSDDPEAELEDREVRLPPLEQGQSVSVVTLEPREHATQPPGRYSEASLVRELERREIGRPSTYASIIGTIIDRGYVWKKGSALVPSWTAFSVVGLLEKHFSRLVDYEFTAAMEQDLDRIANGEEETIPWLQRFYFGNGHVGLRALVTEHIDEIDPREINSISIGSDGDGAPIVVRVGRYGPFLQCGEQTASIPEGVPPDELTVERAEELLARPSQERTLGEDPDTGQPVYVKSGRYGPYVQLGDPPEGDKPRTASLFKTMDMASVTLEDALALLSLPRVVGRDPSDGQEILALNGPYGPYIKKGKETRSLQSEDQIFTVGLDDALKLLAQPKSGAARGSTVLRDLGKDPMTDGTVQVKTGRYGPYVTDGKTNVSLPKGESPDAISLERAAELLAEKRAKGPSKRKTSRKTSKKSTGRKGAGRAKKS